MSRATYIQPNLEEWTDKFHFFTNIRIRYCETDMSGHLNNTHHIVYFEQGRLEYLEQLQFHHLPLTAVTADICCHYHSEAFLWEELKLGVRTARLGNSSLDLEYCLQTAADQRLVATGRGTLVFIDQNTKKSTPIPDELRKQIEMVEGIGTA